MNKCPASQDGICRNVIGFGIECNGYSEICVLKQQYDNLQNIARGFDRSVKHCFGIHGDGKQDIKKNIEKQVNFFQNQVKTMLSTINSYEFRKALRDVAKIAVAVKELEERKREK